PAPYWRSDAPGHPGARKRPETPSERLACRKRSDTACVQSISGLSGQIPSNGGTDEASDDHGGGSGISGAGLRRRRRPERARHQTGPAGRASGSAGAPAGQPRYPAGPARAGQRSAGAPRSEEHTSELQSRGHLVCRLLLEKKKTIVCKTVDFLRGIVNELDVL